MPRRPDPSSLRSRAAATGVPRSTLHRRDRGVKPRAESLAAKARNAGIPLSTVRSRIERGWTEEAALQPKEKA